MSKKIKWMPGIGAIFFMAFLIYSSSPVCELEKAYTTCYPDPPSDEPCDTWIGTNYAGLENGPFTSEQCRLLGTVAKYCLGAAAITWAVALMFRLVKRKQS